MFIRASKQQKLVSFCLLLATTTFGMRCLEELLKQTKPNEITTNLCLVKRIYLFNHPIITISQPCVSTQNMWLLFYFRSNKFYRVNGLLRSKVKLPNWIKLQKYQLRSKLFVTSLSKERQKFHTSSILHLCAYVFIFLFWFIFILSLCHARTHTHSSPSHK